MAFVPAIVAGVQAVGGFIAANAAAISATSSVIGGGLSAYASHQQGKAAEAQARYQASVTRSNATQKQYDARVNEQTAETKAKNASLQGAERGRRILAKSKRATASFLANHARRGLSVGSISLEDSLKSFDSLNKSEALSSSYQTALETQGLRQRGRSMAVFGERAMAFGSDQSSMLIASGRNQRRSSDLQAIGSGIGGLTRAAGYLG